MSSELATRPTPWSLQPTTFAELMQFADLISRSDLAPKDYRGKPGNIVVAIQMGADVGLSPMQALQNIAVIGGRATLWGDALLALVQASPEFEDIIETDDGETASCTVKRRGRSPVTRTFSMTDARVAHLDKKAGPWQEYPKRMRQMRARGFACRDTFADVLRGLGSAEEMSDVVVTTIAPAVTKPQPSESEPRPFVPTGKFHWKTNAQWHGKPLTHGSDGALAAYLAQWESFVANPTTPEVSREWGRNHLEEIKALYVERLKAPAAAAARGITEEQLQARIDSLGLNTNEATDAVADGMLNDPSDVMEESTT